MARYLTAKDTTVRAMWAAFLGSLVGESVEVSASRFVQALSQTTNPPRKGEATWQTADWLESDRTVTPDLAYRAGEALRASGVRWASGAVALYGAGYSGEFFLTLRVLAASTETAKIASALFDLVPLIVADQGGLISRLACAPVAKSEPSAGWHDAAAEFANSFALGASREIVTVKWESGAEDLSAEYLGIDPVPSLRAHDRRSRLEMHRARAEGARLALAAGVSNPTVITAVDAAFRNRDGAPQSGSSANRVADELLNAAVELWPSKWARSYTVAQQWHRLVFGGPDYSSRFSATHAYLGLLAIAEQLGIDLDKPSVIASSLEKSE